MWSSLKANNADHSSGNRNAVGGIGKISLTGPLSTTTALLQSAATLTESGCYSTTTVCYYSLLHCRACLTLQRLKGLLHHSLYDLCMQPMRNSPSKLKIGLRMRPVLGSVVPSAGEGINGHAGGRRLDHADSCYAAMAGNHAKMQGRIISDSATPAARGRWRLWKAVPYSVT